MEKNSGQSATETAVFGGGCFWCLDAQFRLVDGVRAVGSGYAGGTTTHPTYEQVCSGRTGHAEVVRVDFDPTRISYEDLLRMFFHGHDPTTLNRQGPDVGTQYRSAIFYTSEEQKATAERVIAELQSDWPDPIVTEVVPLTEFYEAEEYHQDFFRKNPAQSYCRLVIAPKIRKFTAQLAGK